MESAIDAYLLDVKERSEGMKEILDWRGSQ